ncbi:hypothetical protein POV27_01190 [Aureisphaera galaxeae]|uniref:hypothetical protein n=1 Tax=Aureisphaera galaxeae TaxID=1538023 RepID=UPI0023507B52|nr:hypothetical protein [Aureisphaera galaxeae]MDC8002652.1 hypothetical protein [Aureisphaera galaxeae]
MKTVQMNNIITTSFLKRTLTNGLIATALCLGMTSCDISDDNDPVVVVDLPIEIDGTELMNDIQSNREEALQTFTIDAGFGGTAIGAQGTNVVFGPNAFVDANGDLVTGAVTLELLEVYNKAAMALQRLATNGKNDNGDVEALISGGEFFIRADKDGEEVFPANPFQVFVPSETFDPDMRLFSAEGGCDTLDCEVVWEEDEEEVMQGEGMGPDGTYVTGYAGFREEFGWTNLDKWYNYAGPKTMIFVDTPEGYDETNCSVFISYDGEPGLALLDIYDEEQGMFTEHYGQLPIGLEVHIIFMSKQDGDYIYAIQSATIGADHIEVIGATQTATEAELFALIDALP